MKSRPPFDQKAALILWGLLLSIFILEIGLRIAGFTLAALQENKNGLSLKKGGDYRILCLGESTTQGQYPPFLEASLNQNARGIRFAVFDEGKANTNTTAILSHVESFLDKYHPDIVVAMMGINDGVAPHLPHENPSASMAFLKSFRTYKLARLLWLHMVTRKKELKGAASPEAPQAQDVPQSPPVEGLNETSLDATGSGKNLKNDLELASNGPAQAEAGLKKVVRLNPDDAKAYVQLGNFYQQQERFAQAEASLEKAQELNPADAEVYVASGLLRQKQGQFPQAEASFKKALTLNPKNESAYLGIGNLYQHQGRSAQAEINFKKAQELDPRNAKAYIELGNFYQQQERFAQAEANYKKVLELNPRDEWAYHELGHIYQQQGKFPQAEASFKKAQELNPKDGRIYLELGKVDQLKQAHARFNKTQELNPRNEQAYVVLAMVYQQLGLAALGEASYEKAHALNPRNEQVYFELGRAYLEQGRLKQAERWLRKGLEFSGSYARSRLYGELATLREKGGQIAQAQEYYAQANQLAVDNWGSAGVPTARNYQALKAMLDKRKIRLVCVQYPMRPVASLKKIFTGQGDNIVFVDNENIFRNAVRTEGLNAYFRDMFGGNFGHCTDKGNRLLGENIAEAMLRELFGK